MGRKSGFRGGAVACVLGLAMLAGCGGGDSGGGGGGSTPSVTVLGPDGSTVTSLAVASPVAASLSGLTANTQYLVNLVDPNGTTLCQTSVFTNGSGAIPSSPYCNILDRTAALFTTNGTVDTLTLDDGTTAPEIEGLMADVSAVTTGDYTMQVMDTGGSSVTSSTVPVTDTAASVCASNSSGLCARSFLITASNVYATIFSGTGVAEGEVVDIYVIADRCSLGYTSGTTALQDISGGANTNVTVNYTSGKFTTAAPVWATPANTGTFDVVVDVNQDGLYDSGDVVAIVDQSPSDANNPGGLCAPGFTVQNPATSSNVIMQIAMDKNRAYQDVFQKASGDDVYAQVQSLTRLSHQFGVKKYIVQHQDTWTTGDTLTDVIDPTLDEVQNGCTNQQRRLIGPVALLNPGCYDVVFDVNANGQYDAGGDAVDNIDLNGSSTCGFIVSGDTGAVVISTITDSTGASVKGGTSTSTSSKVTVTGTTSGFTSSATVKAYAVQGSQQGGAVTGSWVADTFTVSDVPLLSGANTVFVLITEGTGTSMVIGSASATVTWNPGGSTGANDFLAVVTWLSSTDMDTHLVKPFGSGFAGSGSASDTSDCHWTNCSQANNEALLWTSTAGSQTTASDTSSGAIARLDLDCIGCSSKTETMWIQDMAAVVTTSTAGNFLLCVYAFTGTDTPSAAVSINGIAQIQLTAPSSISSSTSTNTWFAGYAARDASGNLTWHAVNTVGGTSVCVSP